MKNVHILLDLMSKWLPMVQANVTFFCVTAINKFFTFIYEIHLHILVSIALHFQYSRI